MKEYADLRSVRPLSLGQLLVKPVFSAEDGELLVASVEFLQGAERRLLAQAPPSLLREQCPHAEGDLWGRVRELNVVRDTVVRLVALA